MILIEHRKKSILEIARKIRSGGMIIPENPCLYGLRSASDCLMMIAFHGFRFHFAAVVSDDRRTLTPVTGIDFLRAVDRFFNYGAMLYFSLPEFKKWDGLRIDQLDAATKRRFGDRELIQCQEIAKEPWCHDGFFDDRMRAISLIHKTR